MLKLMLDLQDYANNSKPVLFAEQTELSITWIITMSIKNTGNNINVYIEKNINNKSKNIVASIIN